MIDGYNYNNCINNIDKKFDYNNIFEKNRFITGSFEIYDNYFYVSFLSNIDYSLRKEFIRELKSSNIEEILSSDKCLFIHNAINEFQSKKGFNNYGIIIYPDTSHNYLVKYCVDLIYKWIKVKKCNTKLFEITKTVPKFIYIDEKEYSKNKEKADKYLKNIHKLDYFSISKNGNSYRRYVRNFLEIINLNLVLELKSATENTKILIFDDINYTGSTLREILRIMNQVNDKLNIDIYTVIGKK